jgi:S1-C subfamily serine protease
MKCKLLLAFVLFHWISFVLAQLGVAQGQITNPTTAEIFKQFSEQVVKIEVVESGSGAKASVGSGFFATERGQIVTNYHVVSKLIHSPDRYRIDIVAASGQIGQAAVLAFDVIYDLAVLRIDRAVKGFLRFETTPVAQGTRLYSLGHPQDLGLTIVEGTYNGLLQHSLYPKVHFTGSLNPGMSGGPTVTPAGKVVGINVATEGEQISFLVPAILTECFPTPHRALPSAPIRCRPSRRIFFAVGLTRSAARSFRTSSSVMTVQPTITFSFPASSPQGLCAFITSCFRPKS